MKRLLVLVLAVGLACGARARTQRRVYRVEPAAPCTACPVVLDGVPSWAESAAVTSGGRTFPCQLDRALGELAFVADLSGAQRFRVVFSSKPARETTPVRVHAQMWWKNPDKTLRAADTLASTRDDMYHKLYHHGPAFESEYAAYRIYFDKKQTIDTYGKKRPRLELAETLWYPSDEQLAAGYGHDNLRVFGSVGVGTLKGWDADRCRMTHITDCARREARILAAGPVRTVVEMRVEGWRYCGREIALTARYLLYAGHSDVRVENRLEGDFRGLTFVTGVLKMARNEAVRSEHAIAAYGCDFPENDTLKWERECVGLAVAVPRERIVSQIDDRANYLFQLTPDADGRIDYVFDMWWRKSAWLDGLTDEEFPERMLRAAEAALPQARVVRLR